MTEPVETPQEQNQPEESNSPDTQLATMLAEIVDESGRQKYADLPTAIKALKDSQEYISVLKNQHRELESKLNQTEEVATVQELIDSLKQTTQPESSDQPVTEKPVEGVSLEEKFRQFLNSEKAKEKESQNLNAVTSKLAERYGEKATEVYESKARDLGISKEFLDDLARKSPAAVLEYFKTSGQPTSVAPGSTVNTEAVKPKDEVQVRNVMYGASYKEAKSFWDSLRKE